MMWLDVVVTVGRVVDGVLLWSPVWGPLLVGALCVAWGLYGTPRRWRRAARPQASASVHPRPGSCTVLVRAPRRPGPLVGGCPCLFGHCPDTGPGRTIRAARTPTLTCPDTCPDMSANVSAGVSGNASARTCPDANPDMSADVSGRVRDDDES